MGSRVSADSGELRSTPPGGCLFPSATRIVCGLRGGVTLLIVATVGLLAALAVADALRSDPAPSAAATAPAATAAASAPKYTPLFSFGSRKGAIEEIANTWASLYAAGDPKACSYMDQGLCKLEPLPRFRGSFDGATVQEIDFLNGHDAGARFSNGIVVEFWGDGGTWTVMKLVTTFH